MAAPERPAPGATARLYHGLTSYTYVPPPYELTPIQHPLVVQDFVPNDVLRLPPPCKVYPPGLPRVELPRAWPVIDVPATAALAGRYDARPVAVDLHGLARLLHLSAGVVRTRAARAPYTRPWLFRAAGSAGGRFPLELYVSAQGCRGPP